MFLDSLINPDRPTVALDIGSKYAKVVTLKKSGNQISLIDFGIAEFPDSIENRISSIENKTDQEKQEGNEEYKDQVATIIRDLIRKTVTSGKKLIVGINSRFLVTRPINVAGVPGTPEFESALDKAMTESFTNHPRETIQTSYEVLTKGDGETPSNVLISAAKVVAINFYKDIINRLGYKLTIVDGVPFALSNIAKHVNSMDKDFQKLNKEEKNYIHIDIGYNNLNIIGIKADTPAVFKGSFDFCDHNVIEVIKQNEGLSTDQEVYKSKYEKFDELLSAKENEKADVKRDVLSKYFKNYFSGQTISLVSEIEEVISQMDLSKSEIRKISLSGGGCFFPLINQFILSKFKDENENIKVEFLNPFLQMVARNPQKVKDTKWLKSLYATATGLALRTL